VTPVQAQNEATGWPGFGTSGLLPKHDNFNFLNPARRPQSRKGRLAADALRQKRDVVKEDYYA